MGRAFARKVRVDKLGMCPIPGCQQIRELTTFTQLDGNKKQNICRKCGAREDRSKIKATLASKDAGGGTSQPLTGMATELVSAPRRGTRFQPQRGNKAPNPRPPVLTTAKRSREPPPSPSPANKNKLVKRQVQNRQCQETADGPGPSKGRGLDTSKIRNAMECLSEELPNFRAVLEENGQLHSKILELQRQVLEGHQLREEHQKQIATLEKDVAAANALRYKMAEALGLGPGTSDPTQVG